MSYVPPTSLCGVLLDDVFLGHVVPFLEILTAERVRLTSRAMAEPAMIYSHLEVMDQRRYLFGSDLFETMVHQCTRLTSLSVRVTPIYPPLPSAYKPLECTLGVGPFALNLSFVRYLHLDLCHLAELGHSQRQRVFDTLFMPHLETLDVDIASHPLKVVRDIRLTPRIAFPRLRHVRGHPERLIECVAKLCDVAQLVRWEAYVGDFADLAPFVPKMLEAGFRYAACATSMIQYLVGDPRAPPEHERSPWHRALEYFCSECPCGRGVPSGLPQAPAGRLLQVASRWIKHTLHPCARHRLLGALKIDFDETWRHFGDGCPTVLFMADLFDDPVLFAGLRGSASFWNRVLERGGLNFLNGSYSLSELLARIEARGYAARSMQGLARLMHEGMAQSYIVGLTPVLHQFGLHHWCGVYREYLATRQREIDIGPCEISWVALDEV